MSLTLVDRRLVKEIAQLSENLGIGKYSGNGSDRTIFTGQDIQDLVEGVWLVEVQGPPPHDYVDTEYQIIDFWARSPHAGRAHALLDLVQTNFHRRYHYDTANWHIAFSRALGTIVDVDRDAEGGKLFRLSVQFICRNLNNLS